MSTTVGEALRRERLRRGENQRQAATRFGVSQPSFYRWESGDTVPSDEHRREIAAYLGLSGDDFFKLLHREEPVSFTSLEARVHDLERDVRELRSALAEANAK